MSTIAAVQAELQALVQVQLDACRSEHAFNRGSGELSAGEQTYPPVASSIEWTPAVVSQTSRLLLLQRNPAASAASIVTTAPVRNKRANVGPGEADFTCRSLLGMAHAYKKAVSSAAVLEGAAPLPPVDIPALLEQWGMQLHARVRRAMPVLQQTCAALANVRVDAVQGYINFTLAEQQRTQLLHATHSATAVSPTAASLSSHSLSALPSIRMHAIGSWRSVFREKHGTPRQGTVVPHARGVLTLRPDIAIEALEGLEEYSHVWLLFVFDRNSQLQAGTGASGAAGSAAASSSPFECGKVAPPRLGGRKVGVFATRTPHRLNPIGLSLAKLDRVDGRHVHVSGIDLVDATPIVDIKPYHPADCLARTHNGGAPAMSGHLQATDGFRIAPWLEQAPDSMLHVAWTDAARQQLHSACQAGLEFYTGAEEALLCALVESVVQQDPRSLHSKHHHQTGVFGVALDRIDVSFVLIDTNSSDTSASSPAHQQQPTALLFSIVHYPAGAARPRMRTREWLDGIQPTADAARAHWLAQQAVPDAEGMSST